jgi:tight adherence protein B
VPPLLLSILTFLCVTLAIGGAYSIASDLFLRDRTRVSRRVDDEFRKRQRAKAEKSTLFKNLSQLRADAASESDASRASLAERLTLMIEQSGLEIAPQKLLLLSAGVGLLLGIVGTLVRGFIAGGIAIVVGAGLPILYVRIKRNARLDKLRSQLPDAFDLMSRVIRAGQTMSQALLAVADEFPPPVAAEFSYCYEQQNLGLPPDESYRDLSRRTGLVEIKIFVLGLLVQQQTGGNLAELLDKLSVILRERFRIRGVIQSLTAEGRLQALILMGLPPILFLVLLVINNEYARKLFEHPKLMIGTLVSEGIGAIWIRKIVNFEY